MLTGCNIVQSQRELLFHAIGDAVSTPLYQSTIAGCVTYTPSPGSELHTLGPPLMPDAFASAVMYGAR